MRKETRKYICAELLNYQRSRKELNRIKEKLEEIKLFPAYGTEYYTAEKLMYYQDRVQFLQKITEAIAAAEQDATPEEKQLLFLKFWHPRPRPTDDCYSRKIKYQPYNDVQACKRHLPQNRNAAGYGFIKKKVKI